MSTFSCLKKQWIVLQLPFLSNWWYVFSEDIDLTCCQVCKSSATAFLQTMIVDRGKQWSPQTESILEGDCGEPVSSKKLLLQYDLDVLEEEARYLPSPLWKIASLLFDFSLLVLPPPSLPSHSSSSTARANSLCIGSELSYKILRTCLIEGLARPSFCVHHLTIVTIVCSWSKSKESLMRGSTNSGSLESDAMNIWDHSTKFLLSCIARLAVTISNSTTP